MAAVGPGAEGFAVGDRVAWAGAPGCYAEQAVVPAASAISIPDGVDTRSPRPSCSGHHRPLPVPQHLPGRPRRHGGGARGGRRRRPAAHPDGQDARRHRRRDHVQPRQGRPGPAGRGRPPHRLRGVRLGGGGGHRGTGAAAVYDGVGQATFDASLAAVRPRGMMVLYGGSSGPVPPFELPAPRGARLAVHHPPHDDPLHRQPGRAGVADR